MKELILLKRNKVKIIINWNGYECDSNTISVPKYLEERVNFFRKKYHQLIEEIALIKTNDRRFFANFKIDKEFSYWWITDVYEKSLYKHKNINEILKILAFVEILNENRPKKVIIRNFSKKLTSSIKNICNFKNIEILSTNKFSLDINFNYFNIIFSFLNFLRFLSKRISFNRNIINFKDKKKNLFCSYFAYINFKKLKKRIYESDYWKGLLDEKKPIIKDSFFLHIYFPNKEKSFFKACKEINKISSNNNTHFFIEQFFTFKIFFKVLTFWISNIVKYHKNKHFLKEYFINKESSLWLFLEDDIYESFCGTSCMVNLYYFFMFKKITSKIEKIEKTFFLFENQGWEKSFVYNFKKIKNNKTFAVQNSTIRPWDLRYLINFGKKKNSIYENFLPNFYIVNGDDSFNKCLTLGYPIKRLKKAEALRYGHISNSKISPSRNKNKPSILIVGDHSESSNHNIATAINQLPRKVISSFNFILQEHPLKRMSHFLKIPFKHHLKKNNNSLKIDLAIVSNTTSAAVDFYLSNLRVIIVVDKNSVNLSPLKDSTGVTFLYNYNLLSEHLLGLNNSNNSLHKPQKNFFYYCSNFHLWSKLIN